MSVLHFPGIQLWKERLETKGLQYQVVFSYYILWEKEEGKGGESDLILGLGLRVLLITKVSASV